MRIDAHQHFWDYGASAHELTWMSGEYGVLARDFLPDDLAPLLAETGFDATVAVQARELVAETDFLLGLAERTPWILGVVGWIDLCADDVAPLVERYAAAEKLKGLRLLVHDHPDDDFAASRAHVRGVGMLARYGLTYDLLLMPRHLEPATRLVDALPEQRFVVDHIAKPDVARGELSPWREGIRELARRPTVYCKVSGLATLADWAGWSPGQFTPYLDIVLEAFGPERLMIGSDWPVCTCAGSYAQTTAIALEWSRELSPSEREAFLGGTCAEFYGLEPAERSRGDSPA